MQRNRSINGEKGRKKTQVHSYDEFALIYDEFMDHVPFEEWARYLLGVVSEYFGKIPDCMCDLGCGTGELLFYLKPFVKRLYGLDRSESMLAQAKKKLPGAKILSGELTGPLPFRKDQFQWITCTHDSLNYITDESGLYSHFREVSRILKPGGLYSTDVVTLQNILRNFDGKTRRHNVKGIRFKWSNLYDRKSKIMLSRLEFQNESGDLRVEDHLQRYYSTTDVKRAAASAGMDLYLTNGDYSNKSASSGNLLVNLHFIKI